MATKQGCNAAAVLAIAGLAEEAEAQLAKPAVSLVAAFSAQFDREARIVDALGGGAWEQLAALKPTAVGIDVEGNRQSIPVLVQVATDEGRRARGPCTPKAVDE